MSRRRGPWLGAAAAGLLLLLAGSRSWVWAGTQDPVLGTGRVELEGSVVAGSVMAAGLVALAAALAGLLGGRLARTVASLGMAGAGALGAIGAVHVVLDPVAAIRSAAPPGIGGSGAADRVSVATLTPWPWVTLVICAALVAAGVWALLTSAATPPRTTPSQRPRDPWVALDHGQDPTDPS